MRRALAVLAAVSLLGAALPGVTLAARAERFTEVHTSLFCDGLSIGDNTGFLSVDISDVFGTFGSLVVWEPPAEPFVDPPSIISGDAEISLSTDGTALHASFEMWTFDPNNDPPFGDFVGEATLAASLTALGEPEPFSFSFKEGNRLIRVEGIRQALGVQGTVVAPDASTGDLSTCGAATESVTFFGTNPAGVPASFVSRFEQTSLSCHWETDGTFVDLSAFSDEFGTFSDLFLSSDTGFIAGSSADTVLTTTVYSAAFELATEQGEPAGTATASAVLTPTGEQFHTIDRQGGFTFKFHGELISVDGTLQLSTASGDQTLTMDDESCVASTGQGVSHSVSPKGPKPGPLPNDTPDGAEPIRIGHTVRVVTGGLAPDPEAPCVAGTDPETGEEFFVPISYTAWWTFSGTGGDITVSTAGSNFDTVLAVYVLEDGKFVQVACVDDVFEPVFSFQAQVTIATEEGVTYYVQAGGFGGSTGRLRLTVE